MNYPKKINRGDTIGLICPCSAVDRERENKCVEIIESMGYKVKRLIIYPKIMLGIWREVAEKEVIGSIGCLLMMMWMPSFASEAEMVETELWNI